MTARNSPQSQHGFTLIEIMIVIAILAGMIVAGASMFNSSSQKRSVVRKFAILSREIRSLARLTNSTFRIVISMDNEKGHSYWIESAPGVVTMMSAEREKELARLTSSQREDEKPKSEFSEDSRILKKHEFLPRSLFFDGVETAKQPEGIKEGKAYVNFFPQGLADEAVILMSDRKTLKWTIAINPLTGRADVFERAVSLKELRGK